MTEEEKKRHEKLLLAHFHKTSIVRMVKLMDFGDAERFITCLLISPQEILSDIAALYDKISKISVRSKAFKELLQWHEEVCKFGRPVGALTCLKKEDLMIFQKP